MNWINRPELEPLRERSFRLLFLGRTTSFVGNAFATVALAFAVLDLTGSKADLGFVLAARSLPVSELIGTRETIIGAAAISLTATLAVLLVHDVRTIERRALEPLTEAR